MGCTCVFVFVCVWRFSAANCIDRGARYIVRSFAGVWEYARGRPVSVIGGHQVARSTKAARHLLGNYITRGTHCHCNRVYYIPIYTYVYCISHDTCVYHHYTYTYINIIILKVVVLLYVYNRYLNYITLRRIYLYNMCLWHSVVYPTTHMTTRDGRLHARVGTHIIINNTRNLVITYIIL